MNDSSDIDPRIAEIIEDFLERQARGEQPGLAEYQERYPELAKELGRVLRAAAIVQDLNSDSNQPQRSTMDGGLPDQHRLGDYQILRELGRGGMGIVYEAVQLSLGRPVALKILPPHYANKTRWAERFRREARSAARLHHSNIVPVFEVGQEGSTSYYSMQLIEGKPLDAIIAELQAEQTTGRSHRPIANQAECPRTQANSISQSLRDGTWLHRNQLQGEGEPASLRSGTIQSQSEGQIHSAPSTITSQGPKNQYMRGIAIIGQHAANALHYAHGKSVIHRDIKPSNLLIDDSGGVWVTDFGLAKTDDESLTETGELLGTLRYMAPERLRSPGDRRSDIYSLGLTIYELLCLRPALQAPDKLHLIEQISRHDPDPPRSIDPRVPRDLETIVLKAIDKEPRRRYQSAGEMAEDLRRFLQGEPVQARRITSPERLWKWTQRNPTVAISLVAVALAMITGLVISMREAQRADQEARLAKAAEQRATAKEQEALEARDEERQARQRERLARLEADRQAARIRVKQAHTDGDLGRIDEVLVGLNQTLENAPDATEPDRDYLRALRRDVAAWQGSSPRMQQTLPPLSVARFVDELGTRLDYVTDKGRILRTLDLVNGQATTEPLGVPGSIQAIDPTGKWLILGQNHRINGSGGFFTDQQIQLYSRDSQSLVGPFSKPSQRPEPRSRSWRPTFWPDGRHLALVTRGDTPGKLPQYDLSLWSTDPMGQVGPTRRLNWDRVFESLNGRYLHTIQDDSGHNILALVPTELDRESPKYALTFFDLDAQTDVSGIKLAADAHGLD